MRTPAAATATVATTATPTAPAPDPLHLLRRATYGPTPDSVAELNTLGPTAWLEQQLNPAGISDPTGDAIVARFPLIALDIAGVRKAATAGTVKKYGWDVMQQLGVATVGRAAWSRRQLFEVMVEFWSNHLNVTSPSSGVWDSRQDYDRTVIRRHALGRFADMLKASAVHPAMLTFLDNKSSTKTKPNENYGRELLELHTVGLIHTESDVVNAARLLTGLTVDNAGLYKYDATKHATGAVTVLGFTNPNATAAGGEAASTALLDYLALHPATAERIARKLCVRFVADEPPAALVTRLKDVYLAQKSAIVPVLRALFTSPEFAAATRAKVRTPFEDMIATVRALGIGPDPGTGTAGIQALYWELEDAGHAPMRWDLPDGYPDVASGWASPAGFLVRWNLHLNLAAGWYPKQLTRPASLLSYLVPGALPTTYGALIEAVIRRLGGTAPRPADVTALAAFFSKTPTSVLKATDAAATHKFPHLVALVLDSPIFQQR